jgi:hypothetical protein
MQRGLIAGVLSRNLKKRRGPGLKPSAPSVFGRVKLGMFPGRGLQGKRLFCVSLLIPYSVSLYPWAWKYIRQNSILVDIPRKNNHLCVHERPLACTYFLF